MSNRGIEAAAAYLPRFRVDASTVEGAWGRYAARGIRRKAVPEGDEDALTMAVEAAEIMLTDGVVKLTDVSTLAMATTTPPLEEEEFAPRAARMLGLPERVRTVTFTQSTAAGVDALRAALEAAGPAVVAVSDAPTGDPSDADHPFGAGAVAFLVIDDAAAPVLASATHAADVPGRRYRRRGRTDVEALGVTGYERGAIRAAITGACERLEIDLSCVSGATIHQPDPAFPTRAARDLPLPPDALARGTVVDGVGALGAATVPLGLAATLAESDGMSLAAAYGSGGHASAMAFAGSPVRIDVTALEADGMLVSYPDYLRKRGYLGDGEVDGGGAYVSVPTWQRSLSQRYRLVGGKCKGCGEIAFPPEGACPACHVREGFDETELPRTGTIRAFTSVGHGSAPPEFAEQQLRDGSFGVAVVELETAGGSVTLPGQVVGGEPEAVDVGDEVTAVIRRVYEQRGVTRYGVKFVPVDAAIA